MYKYEMHVVICKAGTDIPLFDHTLIQVQQVQPEDLGINVDRYLTIPYRRSTIKNIKK
jgi:hypothetical protein